MKKAIFFVVIALALGCLAQRETETRTQQAEMDKQISLKIKQRAVAPDGLAIEFSSVLEDSRCPEGANCIWAGNAKIALKVSRPGCETQTLELNTTLEPQAASYRGTEIRLMRLEPAPKIDAEIDNQSYTATLELRAQ